MEGPAGPRVVAFQAIVSLARPTKMDGLMGPDTVKSYRETAGEIRRLADQAREVLRISIPVEKSVLEPVPKRAFQQTPLPTGKTLLPMIKMIMREEGVPWNLAGRVLALENGRLDPKALSPSGQHYGLFQLGLAAQHDVHERDPSKVAWTQRRVLGRTLHIMKYWDDPEQNARVGARYLRLSAEYVGEDIQSTAQPWRIYAAYNLGAGNFKRYEANTADDDSKVPLPARVRDAILAQAPHYHSRGRAPERYGPLVAAAFSQATGFLA